MADLPLCNYCHERPVNRKNTRTCSRACYHASRRKPVRRCRCGEPISKQATQCRPCAEVGHRQNLARNREKALETSRRKYIERLRQRFSQPQTKTEIARQAYQRGYQACWQSIQRAIQRGDLIMVRERRVRKSEAA